MGGKLKLALFVAAAALLFAFGWQQRRIGAINAELRSSRTTVDSLQAHIDSTDSAIVVQTDTFIVYKTRWRVLVDSLIPADTLPVTQRVSAPLTPREATIIATADSTISACSVVVLTCAVQVAQRDSVIGEKDKQLELLSKMPHGISTTKVALIAIAAYLAGKLF